MGISNYKCLACGAPIEFKPKLGKFQCDYCMSIFTEEELTLAINGKGTEQLRELEKEETVEIDETKLREYTCNNCGAEVVSEDTTTSTYCYYCHSPVIINERVTGKFRPDRIIPFLIDKKEAEANFKDWAKGKRFIPSDFTSEQQLEKMTGMYLPFWWGDFESVIDYSAEGIKRSIWTTGDKEYTKTERYKVERDGSIDILNLGNLAFNKIDQNLINGISPFNEDKAISFSTGYLAGFFAEKYNVELEELKDIIEKRFVESMNNMIRNSIEYDEINEVKDNNKYNVKKWNYAMVPAWVMTYKYKGKVYVVAVNGQTGKVFGELPLSQGKLLNYSAILFAAAAALVMLGGRFIW